MFLIPALFILPHFWGLNGVWLGGPVADFTSSLLTSRHFVAELHIYAKGGHGFDSGLERGYAISTWRDGFVSWEWGHFIY